MKKSKKIIVMGIDGSGKTTHIKNIIENHTDMGFHYIWLRPRPVFLEPLYVLFKRRKNKSLPKELRNRDEEYKKYLENKRWKKKLFRYKIIRIIWGALTFADYLYLYYSLLLPMLRRKENILMDRSYIDFFVEQGVNFQYAGEEVWKRIQRKRKYFLKEDGIIYMRVTPECAYERKKGSYDLEYLQRRFKLYEYIAKKDSWIIIDSENAIEQTAADFQENFRKIYGG